MLKTTERLLESGFGNHVIRESDIEEVFNGSVASRYALVNKALKAKELIKVRRGLYIITAKYTATAWSQYYLANHIVPFSFVSRESALSFHGWIPEKVTQTTSVLLFGRSKTFHTPLGIFGYSKVPVEKKYFLYGVDCIEVANRLVWIAKPLRALMDYIYLNKVEHADLDFLFQSLRVEEENINKVSREDIDTLLPVYRSARVRAFLKALAKEI